MQWIDRIKTRLCQRVKEPNIYSVNGKADNYRKKLVVNE